MAAVLHQCTTQDNLPAYLRRRRASPPPRSLSSAGSAGLRCDHVDVRANGRRCPGLPSVSAGLGRSRNGPHRVSSRRARGEAKAADSGRRAAQSESSCKFEKVHFFFRAPPRQLLLCYFLGVAVPSCLVPQSSIITPKNWDALKTSPPPSQYGHTHTQVLLARVENMGNMGARVRRSPLLCNASGTRFYGSPQTK